MYERQEDPSKSLAEDVRGKTKSDNLRDRLLRYKTLKVKSDKIADFLTLQPDLPAFPGLAGTIQQCGDFLQFRNYYEIDEIRLHRANFCQYHMLCPFCAMRRGARFARKNADKIEQLLASNPRLKLYHVVLTIKNGPDLKERFDHLERSVTKMITNRREAKKGRRANIEFSKAQGGVFSFEIKRGKNSGEWHPHIHCMVLAEEPLDADKLSQEWKEITGDSHEVWVEECKGDPSLAGLEVFAYALKFSTMENEDLWYAYKVLRGKRFVRSFGILVGVEIVDSLEDDPIEDQPYYDMLYAFIHGQGYKLRSFETRLKSNSDQPLIKATLDRLKPQADYSVPF